MSTAIELLLLIVLIIVAVAFIIIMRKGGKPAPPQVIPSQFNPLADVTTVLPVPIHSSMCDHDWEVMTEKTLEMPHEKKCVLVLACRRCGVIDKTVQITSPPPPAEPEPPPPPCLHDWQTVVEQNLDVAHEKKVVIILTCRRCGQVDKTVEVTSEPPERWSRADCRHKWETEKKITLDSAYEQMLKSISVKQPYGKAKVDADKRIDLDLNEAPPWMFRKSYVCVRVCSECGEIEKIITSNFELADGEEAPAEWPETVKVREKRA